jgi:hypothetical protein
MRLIALLIFVILTSNSTNLCCQENDLRKDTIGQLNPTLEITGNENFKKFLNKQNLSNAFNKLERNNINSLQDYRKAVVQNPEKLKSLTPNETKKLQKASIVNLITTDDNITKKLLTENFNKVSDLKNWTWQEITAKTNTDTITAKEIKSRITGLNNLIELNRFQQYARRRTPNIHPFSGNIEPLPIDLLPFFNTEDECLTCDENNEIFSPAVYLLYLMDFVKKSIGGDSDQETINRRFFQKFDSTVVVQDIRLSDSYVKFANEILENYISYNYDNINSNWRTLPNYGTALFSQIAFKNLLYKKFRDYDDMPNPHLFKETIDAYINEFGTNRDEANLIFNSGNDQLISQFENSRNLAPGTLRTSSKSEISCNYISIESIKGLLLNYLIAKYDSIVRKETIIGIADEKRTEFFTHYAEYIADSAKAQLYSRFSELDPGLEGEKFEEELNKLRGKVQACIRLGIECPENHFLIACLQIQF